MSPTKSRTRTKPAAPKTATKKTRAKRASSKATKRTGSASATRAKRTSSKATKRTAKKTTAKATAKAPAKTKARGRTAWTPRRYTAAERRRALAILDALRRQHPDARCELEFSNALELIVATILAAQCTDRKVNEVTRDLFRRYRTPQDYLDAPDEELEAAIHPTGFFRNKTRSIKRCCAALVEEFGGEVPRDMDALLRLPGLGRKSANVIRVNVWGEPGIVVDTHMLRLARRMGFTDETDPVRVERELAELFPEDTWAALSHVIPWHGRRVCTARKPNCDACEAAAHCPRRI